MKKTIALLLSLMMVFGLLAGLSFTVSAAEADTAALSDQAEETVGGSGDTDEDLCEVSIYLAPDHLEPVAAVEVPRGTVFGEVADPGHPGEVFIGWFTDRALTQPYDPTAPITENTDIFAGWEKTSEVMMIGDADIDGKVTILDATVIQRRLASLPVINYLEIAADTDGDGGISIIDATLIQRWLANLPSNDRIGTVIE